MTKSLRQLGRRARGMTLLELILSMVVLAILGIGASGMVIAGLKTDRVMLDSNRQVSEMELSIRRMIHNLRTGTIVSLTGTTSITITSQSDPTNNGQNYTVIYAYNSGAHTLTESSTQFGATPPVNVVAYNVTAFSISEISTAPNVISVDMTIAGSSTASPTRRVFTIMNRNS